jgi:hypothetical protein
MTDKPSTATTSAAATNRMQSNAAHDRKLLRDDIGAKWGKFSAQELTDLQDSDGLVTQLVAKYGLEKGAAERDAAAIVKGRAF